MFQKVLISTWDILTESMVQKDDSLRMKILRTCTSSTLVEKYTSGEEAEAAPPQKKSNEGASRRDDKEARVEKTYDELLERHKENFSTHQLNLWARMIVNKIHFSYDDPPPKNPLITGSNVPKPTPMKDTQLTEAILGAATAFTKAVAPAAPISLPNATDQIYSQERKADIRLKNFEQLKCLQQLFKDNVLTEEEFKQQKQNKLKAYNVTMLLCYYVNVTMLLCNTLNHIFHNPRSNFDCHCGECHPSNQFDVIGKFHCLLQGRDHSFCF